MKFYKSRTFKIFVGVLVVLIIGVAAAAAMHSGSSPANSVISTVFSPLQRASSFLAQKFSAFSINFKSSATLSKQVDELNKEIEDLQSQLVDYEQMKSQNALYKEFLELKESHKDYKFCEASVVGRDAANPLSAFVLNRGSNDGIAVNDPVIYGKYLVGVVTSVTLTQCTIKTILNPSVNTSAYEIRTRDLGFVTTTAAYAKNGLCTMPGLSSSTAVSPGGIVCTSGVGGIYPRDLIIGTVTKVEDSDTDISATAIIKPGADIASITDVFIIRVRASQSNKFIERDLSMGLTAEKKRLIIRRVIFAVLLIFCAVIQNTPGLLPEPFGAHQLAVTVMVVCIAMFERETAGMLLGLLAGVVLDVTGGTQGINAILLTVVGLVCGMLVNNMIRNNIVTALIFSALALLVHTFVYWIVFVAAAGVHGGRLLLTFCLPSVLYTVIFTPLWFLITRGISRWLPSEVKR